MKKGILICGLNGAGKSTLGKALAEKLHYRFIDNEDLYFGSRQQGAPYSTQVTHQEAEKILLQKLGDDPFFVFAAVRGNYGQELLGRLQCAVVVETPRQCRLKRVKERSYRKFGDKMLPGGEYYASENAFFQAVENRGEDYTEEWLSQLECDKIRVDGTVSPAENVQYIIRRLEEIK